MKSPQCRRKCLHCKELFLPDYRNAHRQSYCLKPECRQARKRKAQRAWLAKPENRNYFRDAENAERVRNWQKAHPGYWKNATRYRQRTLQDGCSAQPAAAQPVAEVSPAVTASPAVAAAPAAAVWPTVPASPPRTLKDLCSMPIPMFVGLISMFTGSTLPDDIASSARRLLSKGHDILGMVPGMDVEKSLHEKTCPQSGATPESPAPVQLG